MSDDQCWWCEEYTDHENEAEVTAHIESGEGEDPVTILHFSCLLHFAVNRMTEDQQDIWP